jgi:hypothetical protein
MRVFFITKYKTYVLNIISAVEASIKVNISNSNLLTLDGEIFPKTKGLQSIFRELNISFTPNITLQLNF